MLRRRVMMSQKGGHEYVEIGGIKWATMNIGAESITDYGLYFQWGETNGYTRDQLIAGQFPTGWSNYKFNPSGDGETFTKYNSVDNKYQLDLEDDAANAAWGGNWRIPNTAEFYALRLASNRSRTTIDGVSGFLYTDSEDSSKTLFFPNAGEVEKKVWGNAYRNGTMSYWHSRRNVYNPEIGIYTSGTPWSYPENIETYRSSLLPIRAILDE